VGSRNSPGTTDDHTDHDQEDTMTECQLCGAPGGAPYCNEDCRRADECACEGSECHC
jgi:hypothetical protein